MAITTEPRFWIPLTQEPEFGEETFTEEFTYKGGYFGKFAGEPEWKEWKTESPESFDFEETKRDSDTIWLKDSARSLLIQPPVIGGASKISSDAGQTCYRLCEVRKVQ